MNLDETLIGKSAFIQKARKEIQRLAKTDRHILLVGERGTGKATIGGLIHEQGATKGALALLGPFTTAESTVRETFDKVPSKISTVVARELEEFSFLLQTELERLIRKLPRKTTARIIVTVKMNLKDALREQKLTEGMNDLLGEFETVSIPPLSSRREDIPLLVEHFIRKACESFGVRLKAIDINTLDFLARREWKENILELKTAIERAVVTSEEEVIELPEYVRDEQAQLRGILGLIQGKRSFSFDKSLANLERTLLERALEAAGYNQTRAAKILNLSEANLRYRMKKFRLTPPSEK